MKRSVFICGHSRGRLKLVDRYVLGAFGAAFAGTLVLVLILYVVADAFQNIDEFVGLFSRESAAAAVGVTLRYYFARFLTDLASFGEVVALVPALVVAASMARGNEFVAPLAAGTSMRRLAAPLLVCAALVGAGAFLLGTVTGPSLVRLSLLDKRRIRNTSRTLGTSLSVQGRSGRASVVLNVERYDADAARGEGFRANVIQADGTFVDVIAPVALWDDGAKKWRFPEGGRRWTYGRELPVQSPSRGGARPGPADGRVAVETSEFATALGPDLLEAEELGLKVLSLGSLYRQRSRPEFAAELHGRLAQLLAPFVVVLAALPFVLTTDRTRVFHATMLAIMVAACYELVGRAFSGYLPAAVGGWLAPVMFGAFGAWRLARVET